MLALGLASVGMGFLLYITWEGVRAENEESALAESRLAYEVDKLSYEKKYKQAYFSRLVRDEAFLERVVREKLGFVGPNEMIFRFKDSTPLSVETAEGRKNIQAETPAKDDAASKPAESSGAKPAEKSILRRLFSGIGSSERAAQPQSEPSIRIDMSAPATEQAAEPKKQKASEGSNIIKFSGSEPTAEAEQPAPRADSKVSGRRESKVSAPKSDSPNAIRFRAD